MAGLLGIGLSGILGSQAALNTTANNITNANTPGYSRQDVQFGAQTPQRTGAGSIGTGVNVENIRRLANEYLTQQIREDSSLEGEQRTLNNELSRLDNLLGGESTGLSKALNNFFASLQNAAEDPTSLPQRQLVISEGQQVVNRFSALNEKFIQQRESVKTQMQQGAKDANGLIASIADLNSAISQSPGLAQGRMPNDLLDQRDERLRQLSELVSIKISPTEGAQVNVTLNNGQGLVIGNIAAELSTRPSASDPLMLEFTLGTSGRVVNIDSQIEGGKLGGLRYFQQQALAPAFDELGRIAIALADSMNSQHQIGMDLEGELGGLFFKDFNSSALQASRVVPNANNQTPGNTQLAVEITDSSMLAAGTWDLKLGAGDTYELVNERTGSVVNGNFSVTEDEIVMPGFTIRYDGGALNAGDRFQIQPTRNGAADIAMEVRREEDLAFASPVRAASREDNKGTGAISQGTMLAVRDPDTDALLPAFSLTGLVSSSTTVTFGEDASGGLTYTINSGGANIVTDASYVAGENLFSEVASDPSYQGFQFNVTGQPKVGDIFDIEFNTNGVSDNRNAEFLASFGTKNRLNNGSQSFAEGYAGLVENVGVQTRQSQLDLEAGKTLLEQSSNQRESVSGVNLDQEAGKLIQYQAAYNASAKVITVAQDLFNTLLQTFR
ncbi:flagellar hook-associated protein FlgK [Marinobacter sp. ELB17]|uniref:flagellar hook-associated protein FlgK n=1 Tax=Marinobacter sp. ELB17 TaxID=270374 RepID=UPI0000F36A6D|nr:flagellar hook-associated protein FlgK [Marinobacter sp. ELB17]EAZ97612.1 flagellar hook-associated protein [Marinobacter sp. ELB17]